MTTCDCGHSQTSHAHEGLAADWCIQCTCDGMTRAPYSTGGGPLGFAIAVAFALLLFGAAIWVLASS